MLKKADKRSWFYSYNMIFALPLPAYAKLVYLYLCRCADDESRSFPSRKTIAHACGIGMTSVRGAVLELVEARLLSCEENYRQNGSQTSNVYIIYPEPYE